MRTLKPLFTRTAASRAPGYDREKAARASATESLYAGPSEVLRGMMRASVLLASGGCQESRERADVWRRDARGREPESGPELGRGRERVCGRAYARELGRCWCGAWASRHAVAVCVGCVSVGCHIAIAV